MKYDALRAVLMLSVRELCARDEGPRDLDLGRSASPSFLRALAGASIHTRLQAEAGGLYTAEVPLTHTVLYNGLSFEISGRADGVISTDPPTVDEIKTVKKRAFGAPPAAAHTAQLCIYAYFLCVQRGLEGVQTRLTYYCSDNGEIRYVTSYQTKEALEQRFFELLGRVFWRASILAEHELSARPSANEAHFPFSALREGQDVLIKECYRDIRAGKRLFAQAPTGIGKTLSTLYPAVRALGEGHIDRIFYLTAKAAVRREAFFAAASLFEAGAKLRTVVPHFHLSMQSGSDSVLRRMKRRYNTEMALRNISIIRDAFPDATFTTDLMVGFPGETEEDFLDTINFVSKARFLDCHVFAYSRRDGTPAATYPDQVPEDVKKKRSEMLIEEKNKVRDSVLSEICDRGEPLSCIFENKRRGFWISHSDTFVEVRVESDLDLSGKLVSVVPREVSDGVIYGKLL